MWSIEKSIVELHKIFDTLNKEVFNNELPLPAITIQSRGKRNALGWCSINPIWVDNENNPQKHEINICAENANMKVLDIIEIMLHEMVHYYADLQSIKTTSRGGTFHNKNYKQFGERFGLVVIKSQKYGYSETKLNDIMLKKFKELGFDQEAFTLYRINDENKINRKKGSIKHTCPNCNGIARSTKEMKLICGKCNEDMDSDGEDDD